MTATSLGKSTVSKCRALLDTGAGRSYASASLIDHLKIRPHQREERQIEMMMGVVTKPVELFSVKISSLKRDFVLNTGVTKVHRRELLSLLISLEKYEHLKGVEMDDTDTKHLLPVDLTPMFMTQTSSLDYETLCRLDVLGIADCASGDQDKVYSEFKEQLKRDEDGWYETGLPSQATKQEVLIG